MTRALLSLVVLLSACRQAGGGGEQSLVRLERLAFVPAAKCVLPRGKLADLDCSTYRPILVDRFEVTRAEWLDWLERTPDGAELSAEGFRSRWEEESELWPASWMTQAEARRFAADLGLRLLGAGEWMRVAAGTRAQRLPWGAPARSVSNSLELGLGRPSPVGTFENGRTTLGVYDMVGNVSEWVEGSLEEQEGAGGEQRTWAAGGSYLTLTRELYVPDSREPVGLRFNAELLLAGHRGKDVGLRLCAFADEYIRRHAADWEDDEEVRRRLRAIGKGWGAAALPLLEELSREPDAPSVIAELLAGARR